MLKRYVGELSTDLALTCLRPHCERERERGSPEGSDARAALLTVPETAQILHLCVCVCVGTLRYSEEGLEECADTQGL